MSYYYRHLTGSLSALRYGKLAALLLCWLFVRQTASGQCTATPQNLTISGFAIANSINSGVYTPNATYNGAPQWKQSTPNNGRFLRWSGSRWELGIPATNDAGYIVLVANPTGSKTFLPCTGWASTGGGSSYGSPTITGGCGSLTAAAPVINIAAAPASVVSLGSSLTLTASSAASGLSYRWSSGENTAKITATPVGTSTYSVTGTANGCSGVATITVSSTNTNSGNALYFDGVNDYVNLGNTLGNFGTGDFTVEVSFRGSATATAGEIALLAKREDCGSSNIWGLKLNRTNGAVIWEMSEAAGVNFNAIGTGSSVSYNDGQWHRASLVRSGKTITLYMDGAYITNNTGPAVTNLTNNQPLVLGNLGLFCGAYTYQGAMDEVRIWSVARTAAQIANNCELTGNETGLTAYYKFNQGAAGGNNAGFQKLIDAKGTYNGTLINFGLTGNTSNWIAENSTAPAPVITISASPSLTVLSGTPITLTGSGTGTYRWSNGSTASSITFSPTAPTTVTLTATASGCQGVATAAVSVTQANAIQPALSRVNNVIIGPGNCPGSFVFTGSGQTFIVIGPNNFLGYQIYDAPVNNVTLRASGIKSTGMYMVCALGTSGQTPACSSFQVTGQSCP